ncbi:hypothetical protein [Changchengzhania lutea]|uniref:hypothetical protein n=1 Tax=Changchengzhania lutea TaxID=2049305 RepID=UPI00115EAAD3|nr:hypothetical protein [Changchengzhania lutea]
MKILTTLLSLVAIGLIIFNLTQIDYNAPFEGASIVALITILASLCVVVMMLILRTSKRIEQKVKEQR